MTLDEYRTLLDDPRTPRGLLYPHGGQVFRISPAPAVQAGPVVRRRPWESAADRRREERLAMHRGAADDAQTQARLDRHRMDAEHDRVVARLRRLR